MEADKTEPKEQVPTALNAAREAALLTDAAAKAAATRQAPGRRKRVAKGIACATQLTNSGGTPARTPSSLPSVREAGAGERLTLRQKLGEVRRRIGYIQKRGYNERHDYNYVTAADI